MIRECVGYLVFTLASYRMMNMIVIRMPVHTPVTSVSLACWLDRQTFSDRGLVNGYTRQ